MRTKTTKTAARTTRTQKTSLDRLRRSIDRLDTEIVRLLNARASHARRIGREKRKAGVPVHDGKREGQVRRRVRSLNRGPLSGKALDSIYRQIMACCKELQAGS
jgi:chorismate mutase / prephenate dehydratase